MSFVDFVERGSKKALSDWDGTQLRYCSMTDVGMVRKNNEDSYATAEELGLFVVADGMGGRAGGEVASALAVAAPIPLLAPVTTAISSIFSLSIKSQIVIGSLEFEYGATHWLCLSRDFWLA